MAKKGTARSQDKKNEDINRRRRERYQTDPEYRQRVLAQSKKHRQKKRKAPRIRLPRIAQPRVYKAGDGRKIELFSIGNFATYIHRSIQSISQWEKSEIIPPTPFRDNRGHRFYTKDMMDVVREEIGDKRRLYPVDPEMYDRIRDEWESLGVPMDLAEEGEIDDIDYVLAKTRVRKRKQ